MSKRDCSTTPSDEVRPSCAECRAPLSAYQYFGHSAIDPRGEKKWGYNGNSIFCTLRCGFRWAVNTIKRGRK